MNFELSKFTKDMQAKIKAAFQSGQTIDELEAKELGINEELRKKLNKELSESLAGNGNLGVEDKIEITKRDNNLSYNLVLYPELNGQTEGVLEWKDKYGNDTLPQVRKIYPNAYSAYLKDGVVTILDKKGEPVKDKNGKPVEVDLVARKRVFSEEIAEMIVLGHKANPVERIMHQAEIQKELDRLNSLPTPQENYTEIMRSIAFEQMDKKEQVEALLKITGEKFYKAIEKKDIGKAQEYLCEGFGLVFQKMDTASVGNTNISVEGFKDFLKQYTGLNSACEYMDKYVNDNTDNLTSAEKIWNFIKGCGDAVDHFAGTQGVAFIGTLGLASEAAVAGGIGALWAGLTQAYFGYEGLGSMMQGGLLAWRADNEEDSRLAGDMFGTGYIMAKGALKSYSLGATGKLQASYKTIETIKEIKKCKTVKEVEEVYDKLPDLPYKAEERQAIAIECLNKVNELIVKEAFKVKGEEAGADNLTPTLSSKGEGEARILEGGVKDTELTEVAPFAERLNKSVTPDDLIYQGKGLNVKQALSDINKCKTQEQVNKLLVEFNELPYTKRQFEFLKRECRKRIEKIEQENSAEYARIKAEKEKAEMAKYQINKPKVQEMRLQVEQLETKNESQAEIKKLALERFDCVLDPSRNYGYLNDFAESFCLDNLKVLMEKCHAEDLCCGVLEELITSSKESLKYKLELLDYMKENKIYHEWYLDNDRRHICNGNVFFGINKYNIGLAKQLVSQKVPQLRSEDIIPAAIDEQTTGLITRICKHPRFNTEIRMDAYSDVAFDLSRAIKKITPENVKQVEYLFNQLKPDDSLCNSLKTFVSAPVKDVDLCNKYELSTTDYLEYITEDNAPFIKRMCDEGKLNNEDIKYIASRLENKQTIEFAKALYEEGRFEVSEILDIINHVFEYKVDGPKGKHVKRTHSPELLDFMISIIKNKNIPAEETGAILNNLREDNIEIMSLLIDTNGINTKDLPYAAHNLWSEYDLKVVKTLCESENIDKADIIETAIAIEEATERYAEKINNKIKELLNEALKQGVSAKTIQTICTYGRKNIGAWNTTEILLKKYSLKELSQRELGEIIRKADGKQNRYVKDILELIDLAKKAGINEAKRIELIDVCHKDFQPKYAKQLIKDRKYSITEILGMIPAYETKPYLKAFELRKNLALRLQKEGFSEIDAYKILREIMPNNIEYAEKLIAVKDFPKDKMGGIISGINENNADFVLKLCTDKELNFPPEYIDKIAWSLRDKTDFSLAERLCTDKELDFPKDMIASIINEAYNYNMNLATELCTNKELAFPHDKIAEILKNANEDNISLATKLCTDKELKFQPYYIATVLGFIGAKQHAEFMESIIYSKDISYKNILEIAKCTDSRSYRNWNQIIQNIEPMIQTKEMRQWFDKNMTNGQTFDILIHLARTQKKLFAEARKAEETRTLEEKKQAARQIQMENASVEVQVDPMALEKITTELMELDVPEGMARNAYAKLCADANGNIDRIKLDAVKALIQTFGIEKVEKKGKLRISVNISPKDISEIFKLATGNMMSSSNGTFRPQVIRDVISLKESGIDDIRLAMNIASVNNMSLIEMKARFKGETRQDLARRIEDIENTLTPNPSSLKGEGVVAALRTRGIDLDKVKEKALTSDKKIADMEVKQGQAETVHVRSLDDIVGTERIVLNKFKDQLKPEEWQSKEAFARWAEEKLADITDWEKHPEYNAKGRFEPYNKPRKKGLEDWVKFVQSEESGIKEDIFAQIIFLDGLVSEMKPDNAFTPPAISHATFEEAYNQMLAGDSNVSLTKAYAEVNRKKAIRRFGQPTVSSDGIEGTWVRIEKVDRSHPEYNERIAMIQALSEGSSWCLRFDNAHNYFSYGDIWFFVDKTGKSQAAINFDSPTHIREIEKRYSQDCTVPIPYSQVIKEWKDSHGFTGMEEEIQNALDAKPEFDKQKVQFAEWLKNGDVKAIFGTMGIKCDVMHDGTYLIDKYTPFVDGKPYTLFDLSIDEDMLMQNVSGIGGEMMLNGSALTAAPKLKKVGSNIIFGDNKINDLHSLEILDGKTVSWMK